MSLLGNRTVSVQPLEAQQEAKANQWAPDACLLATEPEPLWAGMSIPNLTHRLSALATIHMVQLEGLMKELIWHGIGAEIN